MASYHTGREIVVCERLETPNCRQLRVHSMRGARRAPLMPWGEIGLHAVALLAYPGVLTLLLLGAVAEWGAAWALVPERGGVVPAARSLLRAVRPAGRIGGLPPLATAAATRATSRTC